MSNLNINGIIKSTGGGETLIPVDLIVEQGNNYIRYYNGLQICWGTTSGGMSSWIFTVTLPKPYKDTTYKVFGTPIAQGSDSYNFNQQEITSSSQFEIRNRAGSDINWLTIGKWK